MILDYLEVVTYIIASMGIVTKDCQCTSSFQIRYLNSNHCNSNPYFVILP
jgi:hypothetical protein